MIGCLQQSTILLAAVGAVAMVYASSAAADERPRAAASGMLVAGLPWPIYGPVSNLAPRAPYGIPEKRQMRNSLVSFDRSGMRNALVRFGKRTPTSFSEMAQEMKRNDAPQPFVRFGRSNAGYVDGEAHADLGGGRFSTFDHMFDSVDEAASNFKF